MVETEEFIPDNAKILETEVEEMSGECIKA